MRRIGAMILVMAMVLLTAARLAAAPARKAPAKKPAAAPVRYLPSPPSKVTLCGEPMPLHDRMVAERLDREFTIAVNDTAQVVMWLKRAARYFPYISRRLKAAGMPDDLKYLAVAESSLITRIRSSAGAVGPWQFIAGTGRRYGLRRNRWFDDRLDPEKSTAAALAYLKELHQEFKSWSLAMAAYNCGERRVRREIKEQGTRDYYQLHLPLETRRYIFRIAAAKIILSNPKRYGYHLPRRRLYAPVPSQVARINLKRPVHLRDLARACGISFHQLKELNPAIRGYYLPAGSHRLRVPPGKAAGLMSRLKRTKMAPPPKKAEWVVKPGDTLSLIAHRTGSSVRELRRANRLGGSHIFPGQRLVIPRKK